MKPLLRVTLAPRAEFRTNEAYWLHVAEDRARVANNRELIGSALRHFAAAAGIAATALLIWKLAR